MATYQIAYPKGSGVVAMMSGIRRGNVIRVLQDTTLVAVSVDVYSENLGVEVYRLNRSTGSTSLLSTINAGSIPNNGVEKEFRFPSPVSLSSSYDYIIAFHNKGAGYGGMDHTVIDGEPKSVLPVNSYLELPTVVNMGTYNLNARQSSVHMESGQTNFVTSNQVLPMIVEINNPPSQPGTVTASGTFETGKSVNVSWYQSTDVDGDPISYDLEVSLNGGTYSKLQNRVTGRSYNYTIPAGTTSIAFRVIAYANGMYGIYRTSSTYTVTTNTAPTIPGAFTSPAAGTVLTPGQTVTVRHGEATDADGDTITYTVRALYWDGSSWYNLGNIRANSTSLTGQYTVPTNINKTYSKVQFSAWGTDSTGKRSAVDVYSPEYALVHNAAPTLTLATTDAQTLYENDIFAINGTATDTDSGNVLSVKYSIDGGAARAIIANVSTGSAMSYAKNLTYKSGMLYDGATAITSALAEGSQHTLKVWAEDDKGGKSSEIIRSFYVVPNRAATLTLDAFVTRTGLINTDVVNISGKVADLDNGNVIVKYKIGNGAFVQVFNNTVGATPTPFNFNVLLADLVEGDNQITIQAVDAYNAITQQVLTIRKNKNEVPMLEAVTYYEVTPPNGTSDGLQLYIEREVGDLVVAVDVFMGAPGQSEVFVPMTLASTANLTNGNAEDTFSYEHGSDASKIVVRIKMTRSSGVSNKAIKKISGVLT